LSVYDQWHLQHPKPGATKCRQHHKYPSGSHLKGLQFVVRGHVDQDGNPVPKESFENEADAKVRDAELTTSVLAGTYIDKKAGEITFEAYSGEWRKTQTHDHPTAERVERMLRNHCYDDPRGPKHKSPTGRNAIGGYSMRTLARRVSLLRNWIADLRLAPNTALLLIDTVSAIFDAAIDDRVIPSNPLDAKSVARPKRVPSDVIPWTAGQVEATCQELTDELRALGYLGAVTGPRQGELLGLDRDDLDFLRREVTYSVQVTYVGKRLCFSPIKNDNKRTVPVAAPVLPVLSEHVRLYPPVAVTLPWSEKGSKKDGQPVTRMLVFHNAGEAYHKQTVNRRWKKAWTAAGVPDRGRKNGMHVLRHSAATRWLSRGLNPAKVAHFLGDSLSVVITVYSHWLPDDTDKGRAIMDDYLAPGQVPPGATKYPENALAGS